VSQQVVAILVAVLGAGGVGSILAFRKTDNEASAIATESLIKVNEELRREIVRLSEEVQHLRSAIEAQKRG